MFYVHSLIIKPIYRYYILLTNTYSVNCIIVVVVICLSVCLWSQKPVLGFLVLQGPTAAATDKYNQ